MRNMFIKGEKVNLGLHSDEDFLGPYLNEINSQENDIFTCHAVFPKDMQSLKDYREMKRKNNDIWLGIYSKETDAHVGNIELCNISMLHSSAEFAIILWAEGGKGLAEEASRLIIKHAFEKLNLNRIQLGVNEENMGALKLYNKLGFKQEGILREAFCRNANFSNVITMGLLRSEFS